MKRVTPLILLLGLAGSLLAQYNPIAPPSTFRSESNPLYWKNRAPHPGYWQQDVEYKIKARLDDENDRIEGELDLVYYNNSPDDLTELFFHLYQNAFQPNSYQSELQNRRFLKGKTPSDYQGTDVSELTVNGEAMTFDLDNTILRVVLKEPLKSGDQLMVSCKFITRLNPRYAGRMKLYSAFGNKHFNVVHWYPRISVYDRKFGWTTDQHLGKEFYGDFGTFDVEITLPEHYVMDATGFLLNREEVLPAALRKKLDLQNFASKPWGEAPSEIIPVSSKTKTWKFYAENVHDFAWTADPSYRIGEEDAVLEDGTVVKCIALAQEQHASGWQNAAFFTAKVIETYSRDFGPYGYHKMIVADARDGMEYPMLTLDGGRDPGYRGLLAHEVGHNWFFGMVGNNETYRAALDEGFTEFLTSWAMERIGTIEQDQNAPVRKVDPIKLRYQEALNYYYYAAIQRNDDPPLNTHSSHFEGSGYGQVYSKTATMLYNLQYVLGDSLFLEAISHYFNQWKFAHPYFHDFRTSVIQFTGTDLNWFFDQWLETDKDLDYRISKVRRTGNDNEYKVTFKRVGGMQMPLDFTVTERDGSLKHYHVPNTWFEKETKATILPKWTGFNKLRPTYEATVQTESGLASIEIDTTERFADVYQLDNQLPFPVDIKLDRLQRSYTNYRKYRMRWRPDLWYNGYDGLRLGLRLKSDYARTYHKVDAGLWFNTGVGQQPDLLNDANLEDDFNRLAYRLNYSTRLRNWDQSVYVSAGSRWMDGLAAQKLEAVKAFSNGVTRFGIGAHSLYRPETSDLNYLLYPELWNEDQFNNFLETYLEHRYYYGRRNTGFVRLELRNPFFFSDYNYGWLRLETKNYQGLADMLLRIRTVMQWGDGNNWAPESQLYLAGASPEELMDNPIARAHGFIPGDLYGFSNGTGNFQMGGGLGLRGYNNYFVPEVNEDEVLRYAFASQTGLAVNSELEFDEYLPLRFGRSERFVKLHTYAFADAGVITLNRVSEDLELAQFRADAGLGCALEIRRWGKFSGVEPITIRADFPLFLNRPPASEEFFEFRWLLGIGRTF